MPSFWYKAKKDAGHAVSGTVEAHSPQEALDMINAMGLVPVEIAQEQGGASVHVDHRRVVSQKSVLIFSKQLVALLKSGVPLLKALQLLAQQTSTKSLALMINQMAVGIQQGRSLSSCLADYPQVFSHLYVAMIKAGEEMGQLKQMLLNMADYIGQQEEFKAKMRQALVYPCLMLVIGILAVIFILTAVMPKVVVIFRETHQSLPWPTQMVISISSFLQSWGLWLLVLVSIGLLIMTRLSLTAWGKQWGGKILLSIPLINHLIIKVNLSRFLRTWQLLLNAGVGVVKSIDVALPTMDNPQMRHEWALVGRFIEAGESMAHSLEHVRYSPPMMSSQLAIAQESGNLAEALGDIAQGYQEDVNAMIRSMMVLFEPLLIVAVGMVVGFLVFAMLMPIFSMDLMAR